MSENSNPTNPFANRMGNKPKNKPDLSINNKSINDFAPNQKKLNQNYSMNAGRFLINYNNCYNLLGYWLVQIYFINFIKILNTEDLKIALF